MRSHKTTKAQDAALMQSRRKSVADSVRRHKMRERGETLPLAAKRKQIAQWWAARGF